MKKVFVSLLLGAMTMASVAGCGEKESVSMNAVEENTEKVNPEEVNTEEVKVEKTDDVESEETSVYLDTFFPRAEDSYVGDVMAMAGEDGIYLNYLYDTNHNGTGYHPIHRFYTEDFCTYKDCGEVLPFGKELEAPDLAVGTGCFVKDNEGKYHCFYTGHNDHADSLGIDKECIMHAISDDNENYTKVAEDTFYAPEGYSTNDFRDPQVYWSEDEQCYIMLVGAKKIDIEGSSIVKYTSQDLSTWTFQGDFYNSGNLYFMECPDIFQIGDWYYMVFSWNNVTYYRMAQSVNGPWITPEIDTFDGNAFYAAKTLEKDGTRYLIGFVDHKKRENDVLKYTWAGNVLVYELAQQEDGTLGVNVPHQYKKCFDKEIFNSEQIVESERLGLLPDSILLEADVRFDAESGKAGLAFGISDENPTGYKITFDCENDVISYDAYLNEQRFNFEENETYHINIIVENEIVVVYVNGEKALSNRIYSAVGNEWEMYIEQNALFENVKILSRDVK